jgi:hypothetical protein
VCLDEGGKAETLIAKIDTRRGTPMQIKTKVRAGGVTLQHNQGLKVRSKV